MNNLSDEEELKQIEELYKKYGKEGEIVYEAICTYFGRRVQITEKEIEKVD